MACPAGYGPGGKVHLALRKADDEKYVKPIIFDTIQEPVELRQLAQESIFLLGGHFAILCQFAHPRLAEGTYKHSNFKYRIMNRLLTTARFLNAAVYGTQAEKEAIFSVIHSRHADVKGEHYYADDPELHKWTAATLFVSLIMVHEAFLGKVSRERQETLYKEAAVYGTSLRMPPEMWPATLDEFWKYWNHNIETLEVTDWARSLAKDLMYPRKMPLWYHPAAPIARVLTTHWLPERFQREYGMKTTAWNTGMYHFIVGYTAVMWPLIPAKLRHMTSNAYMKDMKQAVKRIEETGRWH
jgi:uncharacterized protein (DUF2236 family)